jgi:diguanylate cyclase (GGDEF)-like protein
VTPRAIEFDNAPTPEETDSSALALSALEVIEQPLLIFDRSGQLTFANVAARSLRVGDEPFLPGLHHRDLLPIVDPRNGAPLAGFRHPFERAMQGEGTIHERVQVAHDSTERTMLDVVVRPLGGASAPAGILVTLQPPAAPGDPAPASGPADDEVVAEATRLLDDIGDPEEGPGVICRLVSRTCKAAAAVVWERHPRGAMLRCLDGPIEESLRRDIRQGAAAAMQAGRRGVSEHMIADDGAETRFVTLWHEPLVLRGDTLGVLSVLWDGQLQQTGRPLGLVPKLAEHAAEALERANLLDNLSAAASTDPLTGVANRRACEERLERELVRSVNEGGPLSVLLVDLDHFRAFNQHNGDPAGDRLLRESARNWAEQLRGSDLLARVGGEEFVAVLPDCPPEGAMVVASRLRAVVPREQTCSIGVVTWDGAGDVEMLLGRAERALLRAKELGRDRIEVLAPAGQA